MYPEFQASQALPELYCLMLICLVTDSKETRAVCEQRYSVTGREQRDNDDTRPGGRGNGEKKWQFSSSNELRKQVKAVLRTVLTEKRFR